MAKKEFNINEYSNAKILSPEKYEIWLKQVQAKDNNEQEMQQLVDRLENDRMDAQDRRKKLFKKWWLKEIISAAAIVGMAFLGNAITAFSPFSFLIAGLILGAVVNVAIFTVIPAIRLARNPYKPLLELENQLKKQKELKNVKTDVKVLTKNQEKAKNLVDTQVKEDAEEKVYGPETGNGIVPKPAIAVEGTQENANTNSSIQPISNSGIIKRITEDEEQEINKNVEATQTQTEEKELIDTDEDKSNPKYIFRVKAKMMNASGVCLDENVFVNIVTTDLDKFIDTLNKKKFENKELKISNSRKTKMLKSDIEKDQLARELIDLKLKNNQITQKQADKLKSKLASVEFVVEITNMANPSSQNNKVGETRGYSIGEKQDFFKTVEKIKNRVLEQAMELKQAEEKVQ